MSDNSPTSAVGKLVRPMEEGDLRQVFEWRNHSEVRKYMYHQHLIGPEEHRAWFERSSGQPWQHLLVYEVAGERLGFAKLTLINESPVADWGFYAAPGAPKGTGRRLGEAVLAYAFIDLGLHKVCGQVLGFNTRSIQFHRQLGFRDEGVLRDQYFDGSGYHPVYCFGLLAAEWEAGTRKS